MTTRRQLLRNASGAAATMMMAKPGFAKPANSARANGFRLPEEAGPHLRTFMQWPVSGIVHRDPDFLDMLQQTIADIANAIADFEPVVMLMNKRFEKPARQKLGSGIKIWHVATDDLWCRDSGPVFVRNENGGLAITQMNFNGWGNKQIHGNDGKVAKKIADRLGLQVFNNGIVGEAGGVESDGEGTLIAHESSWVNPNRNIGSRDKIGKLLLDTLGSEKVIWAPGVKGADITDYHIDSLARFVRPGVVLIQLPEKIDESDAWSVAAFETRDILRNSTDAHGKPLELVVIPEPYATRVTTRDFAASYVNYYVCNDAVIAAQFGDGQTDKQAVRILAELYPGREIVTLNIDPVGEVGGGIHCATQQQPLSAGFGQH